jgi:YHS domain-containing protein
MNRNTRRFLPAIVLLGLLTVGAGVMVHAASEEGQTPPKSRAYLHSYNLPASGVAIQGYCPVSYFVFNKAVKGKPEHCSTYKGVTYHFAAAEGKVAFDKNPEKYAPAYGGWCAFGMAIQDKFPIDPTSFKVVNGKLLLFLRNDKVDALKLWNEGDEAENLRKADSHWKKVSGA